MLKHRHYPFGSRCILIAAVLTFVEAWIGSASEGILLDPINHSGQPMFHAALGTSLTRTQCRFRFDWYTLCPSSSVARGMRAIKPSPLVGDTEVPSEKVKEANSNKSLRLLSLMSVPLVWGTYAPAVRFVYESNVPGLVFSTSYLCVAALSSLAALSFQQGDTTTKSDLSDSSAAESIRGGLELGMYTFLANSLQVAGLETVPSDRAGFLIQTTTIMVPIVQAAMDRNFLSVPNTTWLACFVAMTGIVVMGIDPSSSDMSILPFHVGMLTRGDALIIGAAFMYSLHVVRLGYWAQKSTPLQLATSKSVVQSTLSLAFVAGLCAYTAASQSTIHSPIETVPLSEMEAPAIRAGNEILQFYDTFVNQLLMQGQWQRIALGKILGAILWCGTIGTAYVLYAQSVGQRFVRPSDANLIYSLQPIFTAVFAYLLLGESMSLAGVIGGILILASLSLVATTTLLSAPSSSSSSSSSSHSPNVEVSAPEQVRTTSNLSMHKEL